MTYIGFKLQNLVFRFHQSIGIANIDVKEIFYQRIGHLLLISVNFLVLSHQERVISIVKFQKSAYKRVFQKLVTLIQVTEHGIIKFKLLFV
jgi:hypothetical protein